MKHVLAFVLFFSLSASANDKPKEEAEKSQTQQTASHQDDTQMILIECQPWPECSPEAAQKKNIWPSEYLNFFKNLTGKNDSTDSEDG